MLRPIALLSAGLLALGATPAIAGDDGALVPELWEGEWQGEWQDDRTYRGVWRGTYVGIDGEPVEAEYRGTFVGESRFLSDEGPVLRHEEHQGWREDSEMRPPLARGLPPRPAPRFAYSEAERAAWLDECRVRTGAYDLYDEDETAPRWRRGRTIGGLLGAIGGGVAGNRIAGRGNRLAGTVIGAGAGAVAGVVIGGELAGRDQDPQYRPEPLDWCESYLRQYEASATHASYGHTGQAYPSVMVVRVPIYRERVRDCACEIVEEEIEPRAPRHRSAPAGKRVRIR